MGMLKEFREFAIKGNIVDIAVAFVIGAAFTKIVTALTSSVIMPIVALILGKGGVDYITLTVGDTVFPIGLLLQAIIDFILVAFVLFLVVKAINRINKKDPPAPEATPEQTILLREIRDSLRK